MAKKNGQSNNVKLEIIDGFDGFLELFKSEEEAIEFIVKHTYFFHPDVVNEQFESFINTPPKYVRKSSGTDYYKDGKKIEIITSKNLYNSSPVFVEGKGEVIVDRDGNKNVRDEIKNRTHHIVSEGRSRNTMKNFMITHIWGKTDDPYFFSSMWNFCITPLYAAALTDKDDSDCFCRQLKNLLKAIAMEIYNLSEKMNAFKSVKVSIDNKLNTDKDPSEWAKKLIKNNEINVINENGSISKIKQTNNDQPKRVSTIVNGEFRNILGRLEDDDLIKKLQDIKYCKRNFSLSYCILIPKEKKEKRPKYYYKDIIIIKDIKYYLCQEWKPYHKKKLNAWISNQKETSKLRIEAL